MDNKKAEQPKPAEVKKPILIQIICPECKGKDESCSVCGGSGKILG